ncbi:Esterase FrsA [Rubripirellula lacrimiformis]|uniref:Esterase FrsA n=1 Tax=Rubripirellula lacrimiformis TaxID=1930273 RepID=A0A517NEV5_9BACT|nr:alpha/beta fold hydrolase [Rubripirellula lacrimiformis]QDT05657.1 Esterase FrsA [Rubripirellula lacrimiformis]
MFVRTFCVGTIVLAGLSAATIRCAYAEDPLPRPDVVQHSDLSKYIADDGKVQPIQSAADWWLRRRQIIAGAELAMGPIPPADTPSAFETEVTEDVRLGDVRRLTLRIAVDDSDRLPLDLYLPGSVADRVDASDWMNAITSNKLAAVVALHPTGAEGKRIVAGEGRRPGRQYAIELARRGYVVIAPDYPSFGEYTDYDFTSDGFESGTMKGIWNHRRCVDFLSMLPFVDSDRIGAIGHSLGGHNAIFLGVFDQRIKVVVSSCGWCPFHDYYDGKIKGWASDRYMPRLRDDFQLDPDKVPFDFYELIAALAPRTFVSASPIRDSNFDVDGVRKAVPVAATIYSLLDAPDELILLTPDCEHDFPTEVRFKTYAVIDRVLQHEPTRFELSNQ